MLLEGIQMAHLLPLDPCTAHQLRMAMAREVTRLDDFLVLLPTGDLF
jgi:hypothetical protein